MGRSVKVDLILEVSKYLRGAREAERSTKGVADSLADAAKAGDDTARATDSVTAATNRNADAAKKLDRDIDGLRGSLKDLAVAYAHAGDSAGRLDISKQMRAQQTELRRALSNRKLIGDVGGVAAEDFSVSFVSRLGPLLARAPIGPQGAAIGAALAVAASPALASGLAAAAIGGAGGLGIAGGIALAAQNPAVRRAASSVGNTFVES
ncbi:MAG TPA: hypothetical protein VFY84_17510, partial [Jiangellales bacterium]|nr:hypothetical protein [Jiangellales bacterium]